MPPAAAITKDVASNNDLAPLTSPSAVPRSASRTQDLTVSSLSLSEKSSVPSPLLPLLETGKKNANENNADGIEKANYNATKNQVHAQPADVLIDNEGGFRGKPAQPAMHALKWSAEIEAPLSGFGRSTPMF